MEKITVSGMILALVLVSVLLTSCGIEETSANPTARIYVEMPTQGYIPGIPVGEILKVNINIESPSEWTDTANGIVGWAFFVNVNPEVLEPLTVKSAMSGYFLYDFAQTHWRPTNLYYVIDTEAGIFWDVAEFIQGYGTLGVGAGGNGRLCELWFKSKSQTAYTPIDIYLWRPSGLRPPEYCTPDGWWHSFDIVEDGQYNFLALHATIDVDPDTLNLVSKGQWITVYIELPEESNPEDIDATTILLNETIQPVLDPKYAFVANSSQYIADHDGDGVLERVVKFSRTEVASWVCDDLGIQYGDVVIGITGELYDGTVFEGTATIRVLFPGDVDGDGAVTSHDFSIFAGCYGTTFENPSYKPLADFNEDGCINSEDFSILARHYGETVAQ